METNQEVWNMVSEIDDFIGETEALNEWETNFIGDMMDYVQEKRSLSRKQREMVLKIWENYIA